MSAISIDQEDQLLEKGSTLQLTTTVSPANATNKTVAWSSSDETVATVDNSGMVTAVGKGTATITVTTADGNKTDTITITVPIVVENAPSLKIAIQQEADDGDAIVLRAGKYELDETLVITKSIKILGPQANVDPRPSTNSSRTDDANEAILTGDNGVPTPETKEEAITAGWLDKLFVIKADNVVIDGLTFDRAYYSLIQSDKKSNNEYTTGLRIENNIVRHGRGNEGIKIGNSVNPLIQKNYIYDILTPGDAIEAINNKGFRILDNDIEEVNSVNGALRLQNLAGGEPGIVRGNVIKDTGNHFAITINSSTGDVIIDDNTITNTKAGGIFAYKNKSNSEDDCSNIKITNNTIDNYGVSPAEYPDYPYKENYIKNGASAIFVSYNLEAGSQPIVEISGNTTKNGASGIPVLCFGGGTLDSAAIPTDLSKIIVFNNIFDKLFVKYINVKSENEFDLIDNTWPEIEAQKVHNLMKGSVYDTIQAAIADAADGDTILIASGTYVVNQTIQTDKELTIIGNGTEKTIIDVSSVPDNAWGVLINKSNSTIKDLTIKSEKTQKYNNNLKISDEGSAPIGKLTGISIINVSLEGGKGLDVYKSSVKLDNVKVSNSLGASIAISNGSNVEISNTTTENGAWGSLGVMYKDGYAKSSVSILDGNNFEEGLLYEEGYKNQESNQITGLANWESFVNERDQLIWVRELPKGAYISSDGVLSGCYNTIQAAIDTADTGDTILIASGTYDLTSTLTINKSITVQGIDKEEVILKGANSITNTINLGDGATLKNVTVTRDNSGDWATNQNNQLINFYNSNDKTTTLEECIITGGRNGVYVNNKTDIVIKDNLIDNNRTGIQMANCNDATVENNIITNNHTMGVLLLEFESAGTGKPIFTGNEIRDNWYSDFENRWAAEYVVDLTNNTFTDGTYKVADTSGEPGYGELWPVELGGSATRPEDRTTFIMKTAGNLILPSLD